MKSWITLILLFKTFSLFSQSKLTVREVFDFNVGDEFHYEIQNSRSGYRNIILSKELFNNDSVRYSIKVQGYFFNVDFSKSPPQLVYEFSLDTFNLVKTDLDSFINKIYYIKYKMDTCNEFEDSYYFSNKFEVAGYKYNNHVAFKCDFEGKMYSEEFGAGLGQTYYFYGDPHGPYTYGFYMVYFKKGSIERGLSDPAYTASVSSILGEPYRSIVYPNPVKTYLKSNLKAVSRISIYNYLGKSYYDGEISSSGINLSFLPIGTYYYIIEYGDKRFSGRLVKN